MNDCRDVQLLLGIYVVGAIPAEERASLQEHLSRCPTCREELAGLASLPALLGRVTLDEIEVPVGAPPGLLDQILARVAGERRRRRRLFRIGLAAAAAIVVAVLGGGALLHPWSEFPPAAGPSISASDPLTQVRGSIRLADRPWGTAVTVGLTGIAPRTHCRLVALDRSGHQEVAGSWRADYEGKAGFTGATAITRSNLAQLYVMTSAGRILLTIAVH